MSFGVSFFRAVDEEEARERLIPVSKGTCVCVSGGRKKQNIKKQGTQGE
jgi:hypothetical protein